MYQLIICNADTCEYYCLKEGHTYGKPCSDYKYNNERDYHVR